MSILLIVLLILLVFGGIGVAPTWGYHRYGWGPSGIIGVLLLIFLVLVLTDRVHL
jgi:hypothetical protein